MEQDDNYNPSHLELLTVPSATYGLLYLGAKYFPQYLSIPDTTGLVVTIVILSTIRWVYLKVSFKNKKKKEK